jgi:hypothetical protein
VWSLTQQACNSFVDIRMTTKWRANHWANFGIVIRPLCKFFELVPHVADAWKHGRRFIENTVSLSCTQQTGMRARNRVNWK